MNAEKYSEKFQFIGFHAICVSLIFTLFAGRQETHLKTTASNARRTKDIINIHTRQLFAIVGFFLAVLLESLFKIILWRHFLTNEFFKKIIGKEYLKKHNGRRKENY